VRRCIVWAPSAKREPYKIEPERVRVRVNKRTCSLATEPRPQRIKKLGGNRFRIRQGQYRIIYELSKSQVGILKIEHRREVYR